VLSHTASETLVLLPIWEVQHLRLVSETGYPDSNLCFYKAPLESAGTSPKASQNQLIIFISQRHPECIIFKTTAWMTFGSAVNELR
jgi:hypothetical protein